MSVTVLLVWPGTHGAAAGNFGVPQLVGLATYLRERAGAQVAIADLGIERALGKDVFALLREGPDGRPWDVIGLSCYSSYDYLLCEALAARIKAETPDTVIVAGGYHASARPVDFGPPFDVCVVGEGERPLAEVVAAIDGGARESLRGRVLGPIPIASLEELPLSDWSFLARYRGIARKVASQAEIYLSRGCPFDCAFCMERAKRETSWRSYDVDRAMEEFRALDRFLGLERWTVYVADALFGMRKQWRRAFLERLAGSGIKTVRTWLLVRVDMIDDEDLALFAAANCAPGFGLESGDPTQLARIRKSGRLDDYLAKMEHVATRARALDLPWGANVIVGHPGETEGSLRRSAAYLKRLFHRDEGTTGFLSVDPFRLYPGSPIDDDRAAWERDTGARFHRPTWWHDGDQEFLSEWVDPSAELAYDRRVALTQELFAPIVQDAPKYFAYEGRAHTDRAIASEAQAYFRRALDGQIEQFSPRTQAHYRRLRYLWGGLTGRAAEARAALAGDAPFAQWAKERRARTLDAAPSTIPGAETPIGAALRAVPRERFVPVEEIGAAHEDRAIPLERVGGDGAEDGVAAASVSAFHAYARTFALAGIGPGMRVLDLGAGTGYGAALLATLVGPTGSVTAVELDPALVAIGVETLASLGHPGLLRAGDALDLPATITGPFDAIVCGFAVPEEIPAAWRQLAPMVVAPVTRGGVTHLLRVTAAGEERFEAVSYVAARRSADLPATSPNVRRPRVLPVMRR